jgi:hypothetical protein
MNMRNAVKQYTFTKRDMALRKYSNWFKGIKDGSSNGFTDIKNTGLMVSKIKIVLQREYGEKPLSVWLERSFLSEKNWSLTRLGGLPSLESALKLSIGSLHKKRFVKFHPFLLFPEFSLVMERPGERKLKEIVIISLIHMLKPRELEISIRQTLLDHDTSEGQKVLSDSILSILWMWQAIRLSQVSSLINRLFLCADIWLKHGNIWGFQRYLRWIMRWLLQGEDVTPTVSPSLSDSICLWEYIWYSSLRENLEEMPRLKALINSGKRECLEDIIVLLLLFSKEPANDFCGITIMRNHIGVLPKKNMAQDFLGNSEIKTGDLSGICQKDLILINTWTLKAILIFLLQKERFLLSEKLTLMVKLRSMVLLISSGEDLKGNMWLLLLFLIKRDWLLNKGIRLSKLSLSQLKVVLLLLYLQLQKEKCDLVHDVMRIQSIKNQCTML